MAGIRGSLAWSQRLGLNMEVITTRHTAWRGLHSCAGVRRSSVVSGMCRCGSIKGQEIVCVGITCLELCMMEGCHSCSGGSGGRRRRGGGESVSKSFLAPAIFC